MADIIICELDDKPAEKGDCHIPKCVTADAQVRTKAFSREKHPLR